MSAQKKGPQPWAKLVWREGHGRKDSPSYQPPTHELRTSSFTFGRHKSCDICVKSKLVSSRQFVIQKAVLKNGDIKGLISTLGHTKTDGVHKTKNSVYINYKKLEVKEYCLLEHKDKIAFDKGNIQFVFEYANYVTPRKRDRTSAGLAESESGPGSESRRSTKQRPQRILRTGQKIKCNGDKSGDRDSKPNDSETIWTVKTLAGQGTFSEIYKVRDSGSGTIAAVKVEKREQHHELLPKEIEVLKLLQDSKDRVCELYGFGRLDGDNEKGLFMCMELCRINLSEYRKKQPGAKLQLYEGAMIAIEMLRALQAVHEAGYLHRDIKPSNFMLPYKNANIKRSQFACLIVDFGLAKRHIEEDGQVMKARQSGKFMGTSLYASLNAHCHMELGRRDDMWSLLFVIIDCINGGLLWRKCKDNRNEVHNKKKQYCGKRKIPKNLQAQFQDFMRHLHGLEYPDKPDYDLLVGYLEDLAGTDQPGKNEYEEKLARGEVGLRDPPKP